MKKYVDLLIIGGGPAGLCAAQYAARASLSTLLAEEGALGGQAVFIDNLENYPGFAAGKTGADLTEIFRKQAEDFGAKIESTGIVSLKKQGTYFVSSTEDGGLIYAKAVILATGAGRKLLGVQGEEKFAGRGVSYCANCDGPFFKNKKIFVSGGGDAACDEAVFLTRVSPQITMLVRREEFRAQKAVAERALSNPSIKVIFSTRVVEIKGETKLSSLVLEDTKKGEIQEVEADALFVYAGIVPKSALVSGVEIQAACDETGFVITDQSMSTNVPGLFAAGDVRDSPFRQVAVAAAEGAIAAHSAANYCMRFTP
jgi:thioredoxin reductase (NADPH)